MHRSIILICVFVAFTAIWTPTKTNADIIVFDELTDTVAVNAFPDMGNSMTIEVVIRFNSANMSPGVIYNQWRDFQEDKLLVYDAVNNQVGGYLNIGSMILSGGPVGQDVWTHVAYVYDGSQERIYASGVLVASQNSSGSIPNGDSLRITSLGAIFRDNSIQPSFIGEMDSLRISSTARYFGNSILPHEGDFQFDADALLIFNFDEAPGSTTINDLVYGATGSFGVGFESATHPEIVSIFVPGDVNCDGEANLLDVDPFVGAISTGEYNVKADCNQDGVVNLLDVDPFIAILGGG